MKPAQPPQSQFTSTSAQALLPSSLLPASVCPLACPRLSWTQFGSLVTPTKLALGAGWNQECLGPSGREQGKPREADQSQRHFQALAGQVTEGGGQKSSALAFGLGPLSLLEERLARLAVSP